MFVLIISSKEGSKNLKVFALLGVISGVFIFVISSFKQAMLDHSILDLITSLQYPFYFIFIAPLFGGNILLDLSYGSYSLIMTLFYGLVYGLTVYLKIRRLNEV